jgi:hypothetical protein
MPIKHYHDPVTPQRWYKRRTIADDLAGVPVVQVLEQKELPPEEVEHAFKDINAKQWQAIRQLILEGKYKAESMLRDPSVLNSPQQLAHYVGWVTYADYVLASLENIKSSWTTPP